jgi:ATP-binding cassette subfamily D (ALD) protein 3
MMFQNGAGKSSIFRCLGGLWSIPCGQITRYVTCIDLGQPSMLNNASALTNRPGGLASGLHQEVFYVPQKPYNVHGRRP